MMRLSVCLLLLLWLGTSCRPVSPPPTVTATPSPPSAIETSTPPSTTETVSPTRVPVPTLPPMTDQEAMALVQEEVGSRGVDIETLRVSIGGEPRQMTIRYSSSLPPEEPPFQAQTVLIALTVARIAAYLASPVEGGVSISVMPTEGEGEMGLRVIIIEGPTLESWAEGGITDEEFITEWTVGTITRE